MGQAKPPPSPAPRRRGPAIRLWRNPQPPGSRRQRWVLYLIGGLLGVTALTTLQGFAFVLLLILFTLPYFLIDLLLFNRKKLHPDQKLPFSLRRWSILGRAGALTCPYCHDSLAPSLASPCDGCGTGYHAECRAELLGGCGTLGCEHQGRRVVAPPPLKA